MGEIEQLKKKIVAASQLENISLALQQSAAIYLYKTKSGVLKSRPFLKEAWNTYALVQQIKLPKVVQSNTSVVIAVAPNRGMYGKLVWQVIDEAKKLILNNNADVILVGTKTYSLARDERIHSKVTKFDLDDNYTYESAGGIVDKVLEYGDIRIVYPEYHDAFDQRVVSASLRDIAKVRDSSVVEIRRYTFDPDVMEVKNYFDKAVLNLLLYRYLCESMLSYKAAEITAMKRAHDSAHDQVIADKFIYFRAMRAIVDVRLRETFSSKILMEEE